VGQCLLFLIGYFLQRSLTQAVKLESRVSDELVYEASKQSTHDMIDWDVNQLDKVANEAHDDESQPHCSTDLDELCGREETGEQVRSGRREPCRHTLFVWLGTPIHELIEKSRQRRPTVFNLQIRISPASPPAQSFVEC
jgi:hypothetical protein